MQIHYAHIDAAFAPEETAAWSAACLELGHDHAEAQRLLAVALDAQQRGRVAAGCEIPEFLRRECC